MWLTFKHFVVCILTSGDMLYESSEELTQDEADHLLPSSNSIYVNKGKDDEFKVTGYERSIVFTLLFYILGFVTLGFTFLLGYWYPVKRLKITHKFCAMKKATMLLIKQVDGGQYFVTKMMTSERYSKCIGNKDFVIFEKFLLSQQHFNYFEHMFLRYYFNEQFTQIYEISGLDNLLSSDDLQNMKDGLTSHVNELKMIIHNMNHINVPLKSYLTICIELVANPFYLFQAFSVVLWYTEHYEYYASIVVFLTLLSLAITTYETRNHMKKFHDMVGDSTVVNVLRKNIDVIQLDSKYLVPGDVLVIPQSGLDMTCDAVLLTGRCIVNESSLTGESFPMSKTAVDKLGDSAGESRLFSITKDKQHGLYNGTKVLEALSVDPEDQHVLALVIRTGFTTLKGRLIRSIIHPKPIHFKFFRDSMAFILTFAFVALLGFVYSVLLFISKGKSAGYIIQWSLDLFTIAIPPALPACMSIGVMRAMYSLKKQQIFSTDPNRINLCAKIKVFVFDKTGTLTEDKLTVHGVVAIEEKEVTQLYTEVDVLGDDTEIIKGTLVFCGKS